MVEHEQRRAMGDALFFVGALALISVFVADDRTFRYEVGVVAFMAATVLAAAAAAIGWLRGNGSATSFLIATAVVVASGGALCFFVSTF